MFFQSIEKKSPGVKKLSRFLQIKLFSIPQLQNFAARKFFLYTLFFFFFWWALSSFLVIQFIIVVSHWECSSHNYSNDGI